MNFRDKSGIVSTALIIGISMACIFAAPALARVQIVRFGGSFGFSYSPNQFDAVVGDTVEWTGPFSTHPLSSTTIPAGAPTWHVTSGSSFQYAIQMAGAYNYQCDLHFSLGMTGTFSVSTVSVEPGASAPGLNPAPQVTLLAINKGKRISFHAQQPFTRLPELKLFTLSGREIKSTLFPVNQTDNNSFFAEMSGLPAGVYIGAFNTGNFSGNIRVPLIK